MSITIASFWVLRPEEHPEAAARNYPGMLRVLQKSCDKFGLDHVVLTDSLTVGSGFWPAPIIPFVLDLPKPLMQACTESQARYLELGPTDDTMFVGADCIFVADPNNFYPAEPDLCVTYRTPQDRYPINAGAQLIRQRSLAKVAPIYRRIADRCGTVWCDDQRALVAELSPMPSTTGTYERAGAKVAFLPMKNYNHLPKDINDPCRRACMLHFRGKGRKQFFFDWAVRHGYGL
jgi:hypothetical protein